ncbi:hypothetical protein MPSEU_000264600 [Mayamaea pseudoterrestris]|nr:hypothetical protein MPSEU_000264600 [Mayamaea pseudoterrestris]
MSSSTLSTTTTLLRSLTAAAATNATSIVVPTISTASNHQESSIWGAIVSNVLLFILVFGLSATVQFKAIRRQANNKRALGVGLGLQFFVLPLMGFLAVMIMSATEAGFTKSMGISLLIVVSSPGGSFANFFCSLFNAELALSVALTTLSTLLAVGFLPANLYLYTYLMYGRSSSVVDSLDFGTIFLSLGVVLGAIFSGILAGHHWRKPYLHICFNRVGTAAGLLLILYSLFLSSGADGAENTLWNQDWSFYVGVMMPCILGLLVTTVASRAFKLAHPETVAASIGCCYRNTGIATSVAVTMFTNVEERAQAVAVPLFYGIIESIVIITYGLVSWKLGWTKAPVNENLFVVIMKTYEADDDDNSDASNDNEDDDMEHGTEAVMDSHSNHELQSNDDEASISQCSLQSVADDNETRPEATRPIGFFGRVVGFFRRGSISGAVRPDQRRSSGKRICQEEDCASRPRLASDMTQQTVSSTSSLGVSSPVVVDGSPVMQRQRTSSGVLDARLFESVAEGSFEEGSHDADDSSEDERE